MIAGLLLGPVLLAGCGQKGPLWMPGHSKDTPWPMGRPATSPTPATTAPKDGTPAAGGAAAPDASTAPGTAVPPASTVPKETTPTTVAPVTDPADNPSQDAR
jgi:predicted small lipoprotein YifL